MKSISKRLLIVIFAVNLIRLMKLIAKLASQNALTIRSGIACLEFSIY